MLHLRWCFLYLDIRHLCQASCALPLPHPRVLLPVVAQALLQGEELAPTVRAEQGPVLPVHVEEGVSGQPGLLGGVELAPWLVTPKPHFPSVKQLLISGERSSITSARRGISAEILTLL